MLCEFIFYDVMFNFYFEVIIYSKIKSVEIFLLIKVSGQNINLKFILAKGPLCKFIVYSAKLGLEIRNN